MFCMPNIEQKKHRIVHEVNLKVKVFVVCLVFMLQFFRKYMNIITKKVSTLYINRKKRKKIKNK